MDSILDYIKSEKKRGFSIEKIREKLHAAGYDMAGVEEAFEHLERQHRHFVGLLFATIAIVALGTTLVVQFDNISQVYTHITTTYEDKSTDLLSVIETENNFINSTFTEEGFLKTKKLLVESSDAVLVLAASGTYCMESLLLFRLGEIEVPYDPYSYTYDKIDGQWVRRPLTPAEKEERAEEYGWPELAFYVDGVQLLRETIVGEATQEYSFPLDLSPFVGSEVEYTIAFEDGCLDRDPESGSITERTLTLDAAALVEKDALEKSIFTG